MAEVIFVGAGPGDPELITIKGQRAVEEADVIIYAGSLVNPEVLAKRKTGCTVHNSAEMTLDQVIDVMKAAISDGKNVARVHTGDPSIYGAIREQIDRLDELVIPCRVIPGVSSFVASAAALRREFTLPEISQTVICTRLEGRTPVPEAEQLEKLASHQASMAIFLSVQMIDVVVNRLCTHYSPDTPVAIVEKATWPDQRIIQGTLSDIGDKVREAGIRKTAQILVGRFLGDQYALSKLYDPTFTHEFRSAE